MNKQKNNKILVIVLIIIIVFIVSFLVYYFIRYQSKQSASDFVINVSSITKSIDDNNCFDLQNEVDLKGMNTVVLEPQYYYGKFVQETVKMNISDELYNNYRGIGDVEHTVSLKPTKVASYNGIISFRYVNDVYSTIDSMDMALDFRLELERSGYRLTINSPNKKVYDGKQYRVVILTEFNYLIIVIIEK